MLKKSIIFTVCFILLLNIFSQISFSYKTTILFDDPAEERLDQQQTEFNMGKILYTRDNQSYYVQSFRPSLPVITRVEILLSKKGNPNFDEISVSIKEGLNSRVVAFDYKVMAEIP